MDDKSKQVLIKILDEANIIKDLVSDTGFEEFISDEKTKRAVCMTLINIGEMVKLLPEEFKLSNPDIPWRAIAGLRDITAHRYQTLRMEDIWTTVQDDFPILKEQIGKLL